jgi:hypothetical protein
MSEILRTFGHWTKTDDRPGLIRFVRPDGAEIKSFAYEEDWIVEVPQKPPQSMFGPQFEDVRKVVDEQHPYAPQGEPEG